MREIKFRAWDKVDKKVRKVMSLDFYNTRQSEVTLASDGDVYLRFFEQVELMQYTGLKDKNGVEIFEGDIVKVNEKDVNSDIRLKDTYHVLVVEYFKEEVGFILKNKKTVGKYFGRLEYMFSGEHFEQCEIIGNIYDNPELLEVE